MTFLAKTYPLIFPFLSKLPPELAHQCALHSLKLIDKLNPFAVTIPQLPKPIMGLDFPNPVGVAAGLDKNADYVGALARLGFGFIEVGTVVPKPQPGNAKPRLFRMPQAYALINRMGFNSKGLEYCVARLENIRYAGILGVNIGKNAATPIGNAVDDYLVCLAAVYPYADYIAVNISSPNTTQLRELQHERYLPHLLETLKNKQQQLHAQYGRYVPLVVKISPDLSDLEITTLANLLVAHDIDGVIATNTTVKRQQIAGLPHAEEQGGLSGAPVLQQSNHVITQLNQVLFDKIPIIGAGGILSGADAILKLSVGASLVQLYTGLIYRGPAIVEEIIRELKDKHGKYIRQ